MKQWVLASAVLALGISACGGGGGGTGAPPVQSPPPPPPVSPPPPPPPPANTAPSISAIADKPAVDEGQPFAIDASGTTDVDGDSISFTISQIDGPALTLASEGGGLFRYDAPKVDADTQLVFEVSASDGTETSTDTVDVTIRNYARLPASTAWGSELSRASLGGAVRTIAGDSSYGTIFSLNARFLIVSESPAGSLEFRRMVPENDGALTVPVPDLIFAPDEQIAPAKFTFADFNLDTRDDLAVLSVSDSHVTIYKFEDGASGNDVVPGACAIGAARVGDDRPIGAVNEYPGLLVGTEGNGLTAVLNDGNPRDFGERTANAGTFSQTQRLTTSGTACALTRQIDLDEQDGYEIYAYDPVRQELVGYGEPVTWGATPKVTVPVRLPAPGMDLVDIDAGIGNNGEQLIAAVFSDGTHEGHHALLIFQSVGGVITQKTVMLPNGVPTDMIFTNIDDGPGPGIDFDFDSDIVITVPDTPYVYVFENLSSTSAPGAVNFADIAFYEVGFGVRTVAIGIANNTTGFDMIVGTEAGDIILYPQSN